MAEIKVIIFDLGGVYFEAGTVKAMNKMYSMIDAPKEKIYELFETFSKKEGWLIRRGRLTSEEFWKAVMEKLDVDETVAEKLKELWNSSYVPKLGMRELVRQLRKNYRVIAFSGNTKERMEYLNRKYGLLNEFDDFVLSFEEGFTKTEKEFYEILVKRINCKPEESILIDDIQKFLNTAKQFGIRTILFKNPDQLKHDLKKEGIKF